MHFTEVSHFNIIKGQVDKNSKIYILRLPLCLCCSSFFSAFWSCKAQ